MLKPLKQTEVLVLSGMQKFDRKKIVFDLRAGEKFDGIFEIEHFILY